MKIKTSTIIWLIVGFIWSIFMGVTAISMGFGSLFPSMNRVAQPFVCPGGQMELTTQDYTVSPVESGTILNWYCTGTGTGVRTEIDPFRINFYAGPIYGVLLFVVVLGLWYFYTRWNPANETGQTKRWVGGIQRALVIIFVAGLVLFPMMPLFRILIPESTPTPDARATSIPLTFEALSSGAPINFTSTEKPLANWNGIPIMPQAVAGQQVNSGTYSFDVPVDSGTISTFYHNVLKSLGWNLEDDHWLGMKFTKDKSLLLVTLAPASDEQSFVVTLSLLP